MAEALKDMFDRSYFEGLANAIQKVWKPFSAKNFVSEVCEGLEARSLNERMRHCVVVLQRQLPQDYHEALGILSNVIPAMPRGYQNLLFPDFVAQFGLAGGEASLDALKFFTQFGSSEFAVRHFIREDPKAMMKVMQTWAKDKNEHVRRLASEGSRPRLPWSFKLDAVLAEPELTRPILETLRADSALYVRKSVANHLNDLSKDHTDYMLALVGSWDLGNEHTAWIVKHACRTLIKKGHPGSLRIFAFEDDLGVALSDFSITDTKIKLGDRLQFAFELRSTKDKAQKLVVDYRIHYRKQAGNLSGKVFKLKELTLNPGEKVELSKGQRIQDFTTRKHHAGQHILEVLVNGKILHTAEFDLSV